MKRYRNRVGQTARYDQISIAGVLVLFVSLSTGCAYLGNRVQKEIDKFPWRSEEPPKELPAPQPVPPEASTLFQWIPSDNSITFVIPLDTPHWLLNVCTTTPAINHTVGLFGPDRSGGRRTARGFEYTLPNGGEYWRQKALSLDPRGGGAIVVFLNTNSVQPNGYRTAHWLIPDPRQAHSAIQEKIGGK